jgi:hypothetical protein
MHVHQGGHSAPKPIIRVSPDRVEGGEYAEVPYDYGVEYGKYRGVILSLLSHSSAQDVASLQYYYLL